MLYKPQNHHVAQKFAQAEHSYSEHALVQKEMATTLISQIETVATTHLQQRLQALGCTALQVDNLHPLRFADFISWYKKYSLASDIVTTSESQFPFAIRVADLGTGTGANLAQKFIMSELIAYRGACELELVDLNAVTVSELLDYLAYTKKLDMSLRTITSDVTSWCQRSQELAKFDLIISNAMFQWVDDLATTIQQLVTHKLAPMGYLAFTTFGKQNLQELQTLGLPNLPYLSLAEVVLICEQAGLQVLVQQESLVTLYFKTVTDILRHFKQTGVNSLTTTSPWTKADFKCFSQGYQQFRDPNHDQAYTLTYHPLLIIAYLP